jgi:hypothetical protein
MKPLVNLSSTPFRNRRLFWLLILALFVIPSYLGMEAIANKTRLEQQILESERSLANLEKQTRQTDKNPRPTTVAISPEQNLQLLAAKELLARRGFSWTQLLNDIERNLPPTVRILRIGIAQIQPDERKEAAAEDENAAVLTMTAIGKGESEVTGMINRFFDSGRFKVFPLSKKPVEGLDEVEYELRVEYFPPLPAGRAGEANQVAVVEKNQQ